MIGKVASVIIIIGLLLLFGAGLVLTIAHDPSNSRLDYLAEQMANLAYFILCVGVLSRLLAFVFRSY